MCSRHAEPGAGHPDSLPIDTLDIGCTEPGCWATYTAGEVHEHESVNVADLTCDYCGKVQYTGTLRSVTIGRSTSLLCDACHLRQQIRYEEAVA